MEMEWIKKTCYLKIKIMNWLKKLFKKKEKDLSLIHVHTFKGGQMLYTYRQEDWGNIANRYYTAIQSHLAHVEIFGMTKAKFEATIKMVREKSMEAIETSDFKAYANFAVTMHSIADMWEADMKTHKTVNQDLIDSMFCCFYLLDSETKFGYNEENNKKKLALIETEPEMREVFFSQVKTTLESWLLTSEQDIHGYLVRMTREMDNMKPYLTMPKQ